MPNEVEPWLWRKAVAAVKRYFGSWPEPKGEIAKARAVVEQSYYRTGWIMGYRAGRRASDREAKP